jgi:uncharacterized protein YerC
MRTSQQKLNPSLKRQISKTLAQVVGDLKTFEEAEKFLSDFLTPAEYDTFSKRLAVGYWLKKGRSYTNIRRNLKVSTATIASVQTMAKREGFKLAVKLLEAEEWANQWAEKIQKARLGVRKFVGK